MSGHPFPPHCGWVCQARTGWDDGQKAGNQILRGHFTHLPHPPGPGSGNTAIIVILAVAAVVLFIAWCRRLGRGA